MIEKRNVEAFLKVNGIPPTAKDEEIRSVLLSARWNNNEVDTALMVLKENTVNKETHVDTLHKVFNSDDRLSSAEITKLLGIEVNLSDHSFTERNKQQTLNHSSLITLILSVIIALSSIGYLMYKEQAGFFHGTNTAAHEK
ncbi:MAG: hypothetical protein V4606_03930 [Patescibacteria group bacterium]